MFNLNSQNIIKRTQVLERKHCIELGNKMLDVTRRIFDVIYIDEKK